MKAWRKDQYDLRFDTISRVDIVPFQVLLIGTKKGCCPDDLEGSCELLPALIDAGRRDSL